MIHCVYCGMPLVDDKCRGCFPAKTAPSRDTLLAQAILTVAERESVCREPLRWLRVFVELFEAGQFGSKGEFFRGPVIKELRKLEGLYQ